MGFLPIRFFRNGMVTMEPSCASLKGHVAPLFSAWGTIHK